MRLNSSINEANRELKASIITLAVILAVFFLACYLCVACYKGDPGHGNTDYPESKTDSGADAAKGK